MRNMKKTRTKQTLLKAFAATFLTCMLITPALSYTMQAHAIEYEVGVKVGDWAKYKISIWWNETYVKHPVVVERENVDSTKIEVKKINNLNITIELTTYYKNGSTPTTETREGNIETQEDLGNLIIGAGLNVDDKTSSDPEKSVSIQSRNQLSFAGRTREVVYGNWVSPGDVSEQTTIQAYWDRETGMQCGISRLEATTQQGALADLFAEQSVMIETNLWSPEIIPTQVIITIGGFVAIVLVLFIVFWRLGEAKNKERKRRRRG